MAAPVNDTEIEENEEKTARVAKNAAELQRIRLEKLMKNPVCGD